MADYDEERPFLGDTDARSGDNVQSSPGEAPQTEASGKLAHGGAKGSGVLTGSAKATFAAVAVVLVACAVVLGVIIAATSGSGSEDVVKSDNDPYEYRHVTLENGVQVMLVHDPTGGAKAAAAMDVHVGQYHDPVHAPGLAHFVEHMLFLGNTKHPDDDHFKSLLSRYHGSANAHTAFENTNYFFSLDPHHLEDALDVWSGFFSSPAFAPNATEREVTAVDNEYSRHLQSDFWRVLYVLKHTSNAKHPFHKFGIGNRRTLWEQQLEQGRDPRDEARSFFKKWYSGNIMRLVLLGIDPLDRMEHWARQYFAAVPNRHIAPPTHPNGAWETPVRTTEQYAKLYTVRARAGRRELHMYWVLPPQYTQYESKSLDVIVSLLGHEAEGSLLELLKRQGLANALSASSAYETSDMTVLVLEVTLTAEGARRHDQVILYAFEYIGMLRRQGGVPAWYWTEQKRIASTAFRYVEQEPYRDYASALAERMQLFPARHAVVQPYLWVNFDDGAVDELLEAVTPRRCVYVLVLSDADEKEMAEQEPWYNTTYSATPVVASVMQQWEAAFAGELAPNQRLHLPTANPYIPARFDLLDPPNQPHPTGKPRRLPVAVQRSHRLILWHMIDNVYMQPSATLRLRLTSGADLGSPARQVLLRLYVMLLADSFSAPGYNARLAGFSYSFSEHAYGMDVGLSGYAEKLPVLAEAVAAHVKGFTVNSAAFDRILDELRLSLSSFRTAEPHEQASALLAYLTHEPAVSPSQLEDAAAGAGVTAAAVQELATELWEVAHVEAMAVGNLNEEAAREMVDEFMNVAGQGTVDIPSHVVQLRRAPTAKARAWRHDPLNTDEVNSALVSDYQIGPFTPELFVRTLVLGSIVSAPAFVQLRTREQLGYLVSVREASAHGVLSLRATLQSNSHDPQELDNRVEAFLADFAETLRSMDDDEFSTRLESIARSARSPYRGQSNMVDAFWGEVVDHTYEFGLPHLEVAWLKRVTKLQIVDLYERAVLQHGSRRKVMVQIRGKEHSYEKASKVLDNVGSWRVSAQLLDPVYREGTWTDGEVDEDDLEEIVEG